MALVIRLRNSQLFEHYVRSVCCRRLISTTSKNKKTDVTAACEAPKPTYAQPNIEKNWVSYGFEKTSKKADRTAMHLTFFSSITMLLVWGGLYLAYLPDYNLYDWSQRQAFIALKQRERDGLPLIDPNLVPAKNIKLPSDEELGDTEIII